MSSVVQSAFRLANDIFEKTGPIDPKLVPIYDKVNDILSRLKVIRNSRNWEKLQQHQVNQPPIFEIYGEELQKIDLELQELSKQHLNGDWQVFNDDGTIVDAGQEMVSNLYNHAVVLLNDLLFHG